MDDRLFFGLKKGYFAKKLTLEEARYASNNRILYDVVCKVKGNLAVQIKKEGDKWLKKLKDTLSYIKKTLGNEIPYLIVRTYKFVPYVTYDVHPIISIEQMEEIVESLKK